MKKFAIILMAMALVASMAVASEKPTEAELHGPTNVVPWQPAGLSKVAGDDCTAPILVDQGELPYLDSAQTNCGRGNNYSDTCLGTYDDGEDIIYQLTITSEMYVDITMSPDVSWTGLAIFDDCPDVGVCLDYDSGSSGDRSIIGVNLVPGTYFIMVDTWPTPDCITAFDLTIEEGTPPPPPPANGTCVDAEIIPAGDFSIDGDTTEANNDYSPTTSDCTGWSQADGNDLTYAICLANGASFTVAMDAPFDNSIYLVLDCEDIDESCVAGDDSGGLEEFTYQNLSGGDQQLYLIVDGYGTSSNGVFNISGNNEGGCDPVGTESTSWGNLKGMYR